MSNLVHSQDTHCVRDIKTEHHVLTTDSQMITVSQAVSQTTAIGVICMCRICMRVRQTQTERIQRCSGEASNCNHSIGLENIENIIRGLWRANREGLERLPLVRPLQSRLLGKHHSYYLWCKEHACFCGVCVCELFCVFLFLYRLRNFGDPKSPNNAISLLTHAISVATHILPRPIHVSI